MPEAAGRSSKILVLGGARSGKSSFAQTQAEASGRNCIYLATGQPFDDEMRDRIALHVAARGPRWRTIESPYELVPAIRAAADSDSVVLVDCLTLWLSNLMLRGDDVHAAGGELASSMSTLPGSVILVSNEVGAGIVPEHALGRHFRDAQGLLNQRMAAVCDSVVLVTAGLPQILKPAPALRLGL